MKRLLSLCVLALLLLSGCSHQPQAQIAATTLPVYEFTSRLCQGTDLTVTRLVTESVSCLHDYSLNVRQVKAVEAAQLLVISGAGMEEFMEDILQGKDTVDASAGIELLEGGHTHEHHHGEEETDHHEAHHETDADGDHDGHSHEHDPHIWLSPANAAVMAKNICQGLILRYPQYADTFTANLASLDADIQAVQDLGDELLGDLSCRELITFHDGFGYFSHSFDLEIIRAVEEESGSEASAAELIELITEVRHHGLPAVFTETNGSTSAASIIARETGVKQYSLDMAMSGDSWFDAMYHNIQTVKEALK